MKRFKDAGAKPLEGFQLRYIYFLDPAWKSRLSVPVIPYSKIAEVGAAMYKGVRPIAKEASQDAPGVQPGEGGATPTPSLHSSTI
jgi:hypothetical protein